MRSDRLGQLTDVPHRHHCPQHGGTPRVWRTDRLATVIVPGGRDIQPSFAPVAKYYGVVVQPCLPRRGNRKGAVESSVRYVCGRWWRTMTATTRAEAQRSLERSAPARRTSGGDRRFEVLPGAQAQVDWGDQGMILVHAGVPKVYSFHFTLSCSRDPFCCYTASQDMATFWDCHRRAFAHFGGVPASIVYDRTKTVVKRHVAPGAAVPLHPEAAAFAAHYGFSIDVLAAHRPTGKGRVERQVEIVRAHVLAARSFGSIAEMDAAFAAWLPIRRAQTHRTHGEVIGVRAEADRFALAPLPPAPYLVADRHLRRAGKDCLVSFEASLYSAPAAKVRAGQRVELRVTADLVAIHALATGPAPGQLLAVHPRAAGRGAWVIDEAHWAGLPDGHTRATITGTAVTGETPPAGHPGEANPLAALLTRHQAVALPVARRPLPAYQAVATDAATAATDTGRS